MIAALRTVPTDVPPDIVLEARARQLAAPVDRTVAPSELHLLLRVADGRLSVPALRAVHVSKAVSVTAVPGAPATVRGIAPVLGRLIPVIDLAVLLGAEQAAGSGLEQIVVVERDVHLLGLLVDAVEDLVPLEAVPADDDPTIAGLTTARREGPRALHVDAVFDVFQAPPERPGPPTRGAT